MAYHFSICDDEAAEVDYLSNRVRQWAAQKNAEAILSCFPSAEAFLFSYEEDKSYDILLLDIEMGKMSGIELAISP